ncbi:MAG: hypothetical protein R3Y39_01855 [Rikenellaceae bacterium]
MKNIFQLFALTSILALSSCEKESVDEPITLGDYPVKEYYLERNPSVNVWGAGMDFIHSECALSDTELDYEYMVEDDDFPYDLKFYTVKSYYYNDNNELTTEGCPTLLFAADTKACKIGEGVDFFDSVVTVTDDMISGLEYDHQVDFSQFYDEEEGYYKREELFAEIDEKCIIGRSFRENVLVVPDGMTEEEVQAVYLVETREGGYAKFMVKQFKPASPNEQQTLMRWQVISE